MRHLIVFEKFDPKNESNFNPPMGKPVPPRLIVDDRAAYYYVEDEKKKPVLSELLKNDPATCFDKMTEDIEKSLLNEEDKKLIKKQIQIQRRIYGIIDATGGEIKKGFRKN